jgi:hypothetical protein
MRDDEPEDDVLRDLRVLASQMHPAELMVCVVRGHGWGCDPGGVDYGEDGDILLFFDDGADTTRTIPRARYLGALADVCMERGYPDEHDVIRAVLADPSHATEHPAANLADALARCARLAALLEQHGWERRGDELHHPASGSMRNTTAWDDYIEALRSELIADELRAGANARPEWQSYHRSMMAAIDALLAEERRAGRRATSHGG